MQNLPFQNIFKISRSGAWLVKYLNHMSQVRSPLSSLINDRENWWFGEVDDVKQDKESIRRILRSYTVIQKRFFLETKV